MRVLTHQDRPLAPRGGSTPGARVRQRQLGRVRSPLAARHRLVGSAPPLRLRQQRGAGDGRGGGALGLLCDAGHPALRVGDARDAAPRGGGARADGRLAPGPAPARRDVERRSAPRAARARARHGAARPHPRRARPPASTWSRATPSWSACARSRATGTTLILITHHIEEIVPEIGRVILLRGGKIIASGSKRSILTAPHLSQLFDSPIAIDEDQGYYYARPGIQPIGRLPQAQLHNGCDSVTSVISIRSRRRIAKRHRRLRSDRDRRPDRLGIMGSAMAANLMKARFRVTGYDVVAAKRRALAARVDGRRAAWPMWPAPRRS